jgi:hypothetical protein
MPLLPNYSLNTSISSYLPISNIWQPLSPATSRPTATSNSKPCSLGIFPPSLCYYFKPFSWIYPYTYGADEIAP